MGGTMTVFSDRAEMEVAWTKGNAVMPCPKDYTGDWKRDFWLIQGPQVGENVGKIQVQMNFMEKAAYDKAVLDVTNYTVKRVLTATAEVME